MGHSPVLPTEPWVTAQPYPLNHGSQPCLPTEPWVTDQPYPLNHGSQPCLPTEPWRDSRHSATCSSHATNLNSATCSTHATTINSATYSTHVTNFNSDTCSTHVTSTCQWSDKQCRGFHDLSLFFCLFLFLVGWFGLLVVVIQSSKLVFFHKSSLASASPGACWIVSFCCLTSTEARRPVRDGDEWEKRDRRVRPRNRRQPGRPRLPWTAARTTKC